MTVWMNRLAIAVTLAGPIMGGLAGCSGGRDQPATAAPQTLWSGYLASLDDQTLDETGVRLEIIDADPTDATRGVSYRLTTGCESGGAVAGDGKVSASELTRPCLADDVARIGRLSDIAGQGQNADGGPQATLTWNDGSASLTSSEGHAEFAPDSTPAGTPATPN